MDCPECSPSVTHISLWVVLIAQISAVHSYLREREVT